MPPYLDSEAAQALLCLTSLAPEQTIKAAPTLLMMPAAPPAVPAPVRKPKPSRSKKGQIIWKPTKTMQQSPQGVLPMYSTGASASAQMSAGATQPQAHPQVLAPPPQPASQSLRWVSKGNSATQLCGDGRVRARAVDREPRPLPLEGPRVYPRLTPPCPRPAVHQGPQGPKAPEQVDQEGGAGELEAVAVAGLDGGPLAPVQLRRGRVFATHGLPALLPGVRLAALVATGR